MSADKPVGFKKKRNRLKLGMSTIHVDKAQLSIVPASMPLCGWQDRECLMTSGLLFLAHVSMGRVSDICSLVKLEPLFPADTVSVCSLIRIIGDVWALRPGIVLLAVGGQYMCALMSTSVSEWLCECVFARRWGLGLDWNDNREEFKWEKKGDQRRLPGGWKRLWLHCYSSSLSFYLYLSIYLLQILGFFCVFHLTDTFFLYHCQLFYFFPNLFWLYFCFSTVLLFLSFWALTFLTPSQLINVNLVSWCKLIYLILIQTSSQLDTKMYLHSVFFMFTKICFGV